MNSSRTSVILEKLLLIALAGSLFMTLAKLHTVTSTFAKTNPATLVNEAEAYHPVSSKSTIRSDSPPQQAEAEPISEDQQKKAAQLESTSLRTVSKPQPETPAQLRDRYRNSSAIPIGTFRTDLGDHDDPNRIVNIKLSIAAIQKMVLLPGETFSFNETTGDTTTGKLGYKPATVIIDHSYATDYGGGICQVSSTLYNAVTRTDLQITERHHHTLPVEYVLENQDATVSYPELDFKFTNNYAFPIRIEASLQGEKVICTILKVTPEP